MNDLAKMLFLCAAGCLAAGALVWLTGRFPGLGHLPGDLVIKKGDWTFYAPVTTCLVLSLIFSLIWRLFSGR